jgi:hypothetical protein
MLVANALFLRDFPATRRFGRGSHGTALRLGLLADSDTFWADLDRTYINLGLRRAAHKEWSTRNNQCRGCRGERYLHHLKLPFCVEGR